MLRTYMNFEKEFEKNDKNLKILNSFVDKYHPSLLMACILVEKIAHGTISLSNINDHRWNTVTDVSVLFGALHEGDEKTRILVSNEKKMHQFYNLIGCEDRIMNLDEFKKIIE